MPRAAFLIEKGFEDSEFQFPQERFVHRCVGALIIMDICGADGNGISFDALIRAVSRRRISL